jgi:hypothetical protein
MATFNERKGGGGAGLTRDSTDVMEPPSIHLDHHHMKALGLKTPRVGSKLHFTGHAAVHATSENADRGDGGKSRGHVTLHIHKMDMGADKQSSDAKEQGQKDGMKAAIDKALTKDAGSEAEKGKAKGKTPSVRAGGD